MPIPTYQEAMLPLLTRVANFHEEISVTDIIDDIADDLELTPEERIQRTPSGKQPLLRNRVHWAKQYMTRAGLLESTRFGHFKITERGRQLLLRKLDKIDNSTLAQFEEFVSWHRPDREMSDGSQAVSIQNPDDERTPEEQMEAGFVTLQAELEAELLSRLRAVEPATFEKIVVDLLISMGFGGGNPEMGNVTGKSGDGGIDGIIKEDALGLDAVYIQAKRYKEGNCVNRKEVQDFVGGLVGRNAQKGVFITTSTFAPASREFVKGIQHRIILIEGDELAKLMIQYNVGVRDRQAFVLKKVDEEFFSE